MKSLALILCLALGTLPAAVDAAPVITVIHADLTQGSSSFSYLKNVFTFGATGDPFNPLSVENAPPASTNSFGGFLGIPLSPTSNFTDRGTVTFGSTDSYATFLAPTTVPYSNGNNFIGLRATYEGQDYYGFAYTTNTMLNSIGFESVAGRAITATTAIPEPSAWVMMIAGIGVAGGLRRRTRAQSGARLLI